MKLYTKQIITDFNRHQPLLCSVDEVNGNTFSINIIKDYLHLFLNILTKT